MLRSLALFTLTLMLSATAHASQREFQVTVTNITKGQTFTPILAVTHTREISLFELGGEALPQLATLAESGDVAPLKMLLESDDLTDVVSDVVVSADSNPPLLGPGESATFVIHASSVFDQLSFAAMLIPTNDAFVALNGFTLPRTSVRVEARAYDAGSEANDELCANIPGPTCGDMDDSGDAGEGYVYIGNGIRGIGDLDEAEFDWNNPVAVVDIVRMK